jgi:uncharacterized C2H2 Zn-finger protein
LQFTCNQCGKLAKTEEALRCHKETIHPAYKCSEDFCNDKFNNLGAYQIHKQIHKLSQRPVRTKKRIIPELEEETESHDDSVIDKDFSPKDDQEDTDTDEDFKCPRCKFTSYWEKDVKQHMQWNHIIERRQAKKTKKPGPKKKKMEETQKKVTQKSQSCVRIVEKLSHKSGICQGMLITRRA